MPIQIRHAVKQVKPGCRGKCLAVQRLNLCDGEPLSVRDLRLRDFHRDFSHTHAFGALAAKLERLRVGDAITTRPAVRSEPICGVSSIERRVGTETALQKPRLRLPQLFARPLQVFVAAQHGLDQVRDRQSLRVAEVAGSRGSRGGGLVLSRRGELRKQGRSAKKR